ncbi:MULTISPECIES: dihydrodipicolinate synthase family protein [Deinococcus]|uniref:Dihydrodipicolinate synthase family protein n=1 Tax=Deinococcus rufus TaxID=2136097 RepID=A0ABV7Z2B5_9DEIO|nr:dihydrodipicolinate synthase family protein [Deinococcus sp. AB2017081]WQE95810.1 dihydrodipicolinate synthase family protein [Deinococcus sp. AB2017081]
MTALTADGIHSTWVTVLLPVRENDTVDYAALERQVQALVAAGVDGVYTNGTAGEFHTQDDDEFLEVSTVVARICGCSGTPFQLGVSHPVAQTSLARLRRDEMPDQADAFPTGVGMIRLDHQSHPAFLTSTVHRRPRHGFLAQLHAPIAHATAHAPNSAYATKRKPTSKTWVSVVCPKGFEPLAF